MAQQFYGDPFVRHQIINNEHIRSTPQLDYNTMILEIYNNWDSVLDLYERIKAGKVDLVSQMEGMWINFLSSNVIDIYQFKNAEEFEMRFLKSLV